MKLNRSDYAILAELQADGRVTNVELAERVSLSGSACLRRVRALEKAGVITGYSAQVDPRKLGLLGNAFVKVSLEHQDIADLDAFEDAVKQVPEVMECYLMSGEQDYLLRLVFSDMEHFERIHREHLTRLPGVSRLNTSVVIRTVSDRNELPAT